MARTGELIRGRVRVLTGPDDGAYPHGNSVLVEGRDETVLIDPSLGIGRRLDPDRVDRVVLSHVHEDHVAGLAAFPTAPVHAHHRDAGALVDLDAMVHAYGLTDDRAAAFARVLTEQFDFVPRPDVSGFGDRDRFEVGGSTIEVVATPGHTPGHCCLLVHPESVLYLGDIDLTGFGPYYADRNSSLEQFEASIETCRHIDAEWYVTFHHKGTYTSRPEFLAALDRFAAAIDRRDAQLLEHLRRPRTVDDLVALRILYRPHVDLVWVDDAERHTIERHLDRLLRRGLVVSEADRWSRV